MRCKQFIIVSLAGVVLAASLAGCGGAEMCRRDSTRLVELADKLLTAWRGYTDESCFIFAETDGEPHNTCLLYTSRCV